MKPVDQTKFGRPEGNCFNACLASLLECELDELPDLAKAEDAGKNWFHVLNDHLKPLGYGLVLVGPVPICVPENCYYIASGESNRGLLHSVIHRNGEIVHDPHPDRTGIKEVKDFIFLVKLC